MPRQFTCRHCGTTTEVADEHADLAGACPECGKAVTASSAAGSARKHGGIGCGRLFILFILMLIGIDIIGTWSASLLPSVQSAREAGRYATCVNNLKQIALAMQSYHQTHGCFPPAFIPDEKGRPKHSWRVLLLPFLDQQDLYGKYRFDEPWNSPNNLLLANRMPGLYRCPSDPAADRSLTSYAMIVGPHAISDGPTARRVSDVKDGTSNTIMLAETANAEIQWLEPRDLNTEDMVFRVNALRDSPHESGCGISSRHPDRANVVFCDGTVRAIDEIVAEKILKAMLTIDDGDAVDPRAPERP
jgi:prepilin-type processing-associated H-X9-DG protein